MLKKFLCWVLEHSPSRINYDERTATCYRCGANLDVSYDMCYGETIVVGVRPSNKKEIKVL